MASFIKFFNCLLPFATPGTPLVQDLVHLGAICALLYCAPQLQEWLRSPQHATATALEPERVHEQQPHQANDEIQNLPIAPEADFQDEEDDDAARPEPDTDEAHADIPEGQAGPARMPEIAPAERNVGAKKMKSIQRRDQRRAFHEFQRSQGEAQRARDAEGAAEREAALAAERDRRKAVEAAIDAKKAKEREERRENERKEREREMCRRELAVEIVREGLEKRGMCDLWEVSARVGGDADADWVEKILKGREMLGKKDGTITLVTEKGWAVRVSAEDMKKVYEMPLQQEYKDGDGKLRYDDLGRMLEQVFQKR